MYGYTLCHGTVFLRTVWTVVRPGESHFKLHPGNGDFAEVSVQEQLAFGRHRATRLDDVRGRPQQRQVLTCHEILP